MKHTHNCGAGLFLLLIAALAGCAAPVAAPSATQAVGVIPTLSAPPQTPPPAPLPTPDPVEARLGRMSREEKVGQLLVAGIEGTRPGEDGTAAIRDYKVGGIIFFGRNMKSTEQIVTLSNDLKALNGDYIPLFLSVDEEGGRVSRMPGELIELPSAYAYTQMAGDPAQRGTVLAARCSAYGFNLDFAPSLDVWSNPGNTVIGDRAFGTNWEDVAAAGPECAYAMMDAGVVPVVKHFPGHGDTAVDSHADLPTVTKTADQLMREELVPFQMAIGGVALFCERENVGVPAVMVAHILMEAIDPAKPASLSPAVVTGLLREQLGFTGMVATDDLTMAAISDTYGMGEAAVLALEAGCDLLLVCHKAENLKAAYDGLLEAVASGRIAEARLDESVGRILAVKNEYGIHSQPVPMPDVAALNQQIEAILP